MAKDRHDPDPNQHDTPEPDTDKNSKNTGLTRRSFLGQMSVLSAAVTSAPLLHQVASAQTSATTAVQSPVSVLGAVPVTLKINGHEHRLQLEPRVTLLDALRNHLQMFGTKKGCDHGQCGACTLHVNGRRVNSCLSFAIMHQGDEITTIEGLEQNGQLHPVQAAFLEHDGFQCGYCTSGQIMSAVAMLHEPCGTSDNDIRECMSGNICRCGAYPNIVAAVKEVRKNSG